MAHWGMLRRIQHQRNEKFNLTSYFENETIPVPKTCAASGYQYGKLSAHKT